MEDKVQPGLAVAVSADADPTHAPYWGVLSDPVRTGVRGRDASKAFLAVTAPATSNSFYRALAMANVWPWDKLGNLGYIDAASHGL